MASVDSTTSASIVYIYALIDPFTRAIRYIGNILHGKFYADVPDSEAI